jgi:hypothetical protein
MSFFPRRILLLAAALPLALPHGWCCLAMPFAGAAASKPAGRCPHCCHAGAVEKSACPAAPASKPCPGDPVKCPCGDRASTAPEVFRAFPDISKTFGYGLALPAACAVFVATGPAFHQPVRRHVSLPITDLVIALRHFLI